MSEKEGQCFRHDTLGAVIGLIKGLGSTAKQDIKSLSDLKIGLSFYSKNASETVWGMMVSRRGNNSTVLTGIPHVKAIVGSMVHTALVY